MCFCGKCHLSWLYNMPCAEMCHPYPEIEIKHPPFGWVTRTACLLFPGITFLNWLNKKVTNPFLSFCTYMDIFVTMHNWCELTELDFHFKKEFTSWLLLNSVVFILLRYVNDQRRDASWEHAVITLKGFPFTYTSCRPCQSACFCVFVTIMLTSYLVS